MKLSYALGTIALGASLVSAQKDACNPLKESSCPADKALGKTIYAKFDEESPYFERYAQNGDVSYGDDGVEMTMKKRLDNPSLVSKFYIMFGKIQAIVKSAPGKGVISSLYLQSDDLDEIDIEWVGSDTTQVQSNFFSKGVVGSYDRGGFHPVDNPQTSFHNYTIDWTKDAANIYVDGALVRTISKDNGQGYPESPMRLFTGIWSGGDPSNQPGTIEWAGGLTDWSQAPFSMYLKDLIVSDYSTGSEYVYSNTEGTWQSIEAKDGEVYGRYEEGNVQFDELASGGSISDDSAEISSSSAAESSTSASSTVESSSTAESSTSESSSAVSSTSESSSAVSSSTTKAPAEKTSSTQSSAHSSTVHSNTTSSVVSSTKQSSSSVFTSTDAPLDSVSSSATATSSWSNETTSTVAPTSQSIAPTSSLTSIITSTHSSSSETESTTASVQSSVTGNMAAKQLPQLLLALPAMLLL